MKRFILLTFGFLGWAFYEMSGGADFQPVSAQMAAMQPQQPKAEVVAKAPELKAEPRQPAIQIANAKPVDTTPPGFDDTAKPEEVSRVSLNLTTLKPEETETVSAVTLVPVNAGSISSTVDTPAIIPSLITPNDPGVNTVSVSASGDIRTVAGNRVNVHGGPGTDYEVVIRLGRGDAVEILQDNGDGWVKMRPLEGGPEGWMADFLLTSS
jgi:hypothetical protein